MQTMSSQEFEYIWSFNNRFPGKLTSGSYQHGPLADLGRAAAMRATNQICIQWNYVHEHAKPQPLLEQSPANFCFD